MKHRETISEKLSAVSLPQLPQVLIQLIDICNSDEVDIRLVAQTVAQDIAITTKTLKLTNSAFLGARSQFKNIDQAVIFLGVDTVRNLAISVSVHEVFGNNGKLKGFNPEQFWYHSLLTALISKTIAQKSGYDDPGAAYLAGLLHDTGKYILAKHFGEPYIQLLQNYTHQALLAEEKRTFEVTHPEVGYWLLDGWNINEELGSAIRDHHNIDGTETETSILGRILRLANTLTKVSDTLDEQTIKDASILCIAPSNLPGLVEEQKNNLDELSLTLGIRIQAPEPPTLQNKVQEESVQRLNDKIEIRAQLYGFMDNIIQAKTLNRVFLALEESLSLLFNCNQNVLLLPQNGENLYNFHGSFRNQSAKQLKIKEAVLAHGTILTDSLGNSVSMPELATPSLLPRSKNSTELSQIFDAVESETLFALPLRISEEEKGLLLLGISPDNETILDQEETLQLLCNHVGNRLILETLKEEYAQNYAKERISAVEDVARSVAHEISTPLNVIQNYLTLLTEKNGQGEQVGAELSLINKELQRIANISGQLNDLSHAPKEKKYQAVDINSVIADIVNLHQPSTTAARSISIDFTPVPELPLLWIEESPLRQILGNLVTNSIDAVDKKGTIEILCHHVPKAGTGINGEIVIVVSDDGPGIPPNIANTIFRAGTTTKSNGHAGLGLAIVNKLTKYLAGRIYHTTGKKGNTQFTLHLPVLMQPDT